MWIRVDHQITGLNGVPLAVSEVDSRPMELGDVLTTLALCAPPPGAPPYTAAEQVSRYQFAQAVYNGQTGQYGAESTVELNDSLKAALKNDLCRLYGPIVGGQVHLILDGRDTTTTLGRGVVQEILQATRDAHRELERSLPPNRGGAPVDRTPRRESVMAERGSVVVGAGGYSGEVLPRADNMRDSVEAAVDLAGDTETGWAAPDPVPEPSGRLVRGEIGRANNARVTLSDRPTGRRS